MWICILNATSLSQWSTLHQEVPASFIPEEEAFEFRAATSFEISKIVQSFPSKKAPGKDELHMAVVRCSAGYPSDFDRDYKQFTLDIRISLIMERIWNRSDSKGWWKSGNSQLEQPVSSLPAVSKICERVILNKFTEICNKEKLSQRTPVWE